MYREYRDRAEFLIVYIQEAHSTDGWQLESNLKQNVLFADPTTREERAAVAEACVRNLRIEIPAVLDTPDNRTERAYTGWPDRLYLVGIDGRVKFKTQPGPFGFKPGLLEQALREELSRHPSPAQPRASIR